MIVQTIVDVVARGLPVGSVPGRQLILPGRIAGVSGMAAKSLKIAGSGPPWTQAIAFAPGLVGPCPGPAIAGFALGRRQIRLFVAAMIAGTWLQRIHADLPDQGPLHFAGLRS